MTFFFNYLYIIMVYFIYKIKLIVVRNIVSLLINSLLKTDLHWCRVLFLIIGKQQNYCCVENCCYYSCINGTLILSSGTNNSFTVQMACIFGHYDIHRYTHQLLTGPVSHSGQSKYYNRISLSRAAILMIFSYLVTCCQSFRISLTYLTV